MEILLNILIDAFFSFFHIFGISEAVSSHLNLSFFLVSFYVLFLPVHSFLSQAKKA